MRLPGGAGGLASTPGRKAGGEVYTGLTLYVPGLAIFCWIPDITLGNVCSAPLWIPVFTGMTMVVSCAGGIEHRLAAGSLA